MEKKDDPKRYDAEKRHQEYLRRRDKALAYQTKWNQENKFHRKAVNANVRARKYGIKDRLTVEDVVAVFEVHNGKCAYCPADATEIDHLRPLSRGGSNTRANILPSCEKCNTSKRALLVAEWVQRTAQKAAEAQKQVSDGQADLKKLVAIGGGR